MEVVVESLVNQFDDYLIIRDNSVISFIKYLY